jgi:hypothetical protein
VGQAQSIGSDPQRALHPRIYSRVLATSLPCTNRSVSMDGIYKIGMVLSRGIFQ